MADLVTASLALALAPGPDGTPQTWLAVEYDIAPGWHLYWENPGDSGMATDAVPTLPTGWTADAPVWPGPDRWTAPGDIAIYGYEDHTALLLPLSSAPGAATGSATVETRWLVCRADRCIPGNASLELALQTPASPPDGALAASFARVPAARTGPPLPAGAGAWTVELGEAEVIEVFPNTALEARMDPAKPPQVTGPAVQVSLAARPAFPTQGAPALVAKVKDGGGVHWIEVRPPGP